MPFLVVDVKEKLSFSGKIAFFLLLSNAQINLEGITNKRRRSSLQQPSSSLNVSNVSKG